MRKKPRGRKYRNLFARDGVIYYQRVANGRRSRFSTKTSDWDEAAAVRDLYEQRSGTESGVSLLDVPRFGEFAGRYLREAMGSLAETTKEDRRRLLGAREPDPSKPDAELRGRVLAYFENWRLDDITKPVLLDWWGKEVEARERSPKTGKNYLDVLSAVLSYAVDLEVIEANPADTFRATLRRRNRTQRGRAQSDPGAHVNPIEEPSRIRAFVEASTAEGGDGYLCDMLQLDAGLRLGEAIGIRWSDVWWGKGAADTSRSLSIEETRARGRHIGPTKSGRARRVALSRRLRGLLMERWLADGRPEEDVRILPTVDPSNYRSRHFKRVCKVARLAGHSPKDLRDTFASQLITAGIQLGYVSKQLGHADVAVTARHYARWAGGDAYRRPLGVGEDEVPADLLVRLETEEESPHSNPSTEISTLSSVSTGKEKPPESQ